MTIKPLFLIIASLFIFSFDQQKQASAPINEKTISGKDLFDSDEILSITLKGDLRELLNDRGEKPAYHPITFSYKTKDSSEINIPVQMRTRGHFRKLKDNCKYPPLQISFPADGNRLSSVFSGQKKLKLVMPCGGDDYVIREWLVYKIYNLITPKSFRARLVRIELNDPKNKKQPDSFFGFLIEDEKQMATRNKAVVTATRLRPEQTKQEDFLTMSIFQYLIGNTDWSVQYLQNIRLIKTDSFAQPITVPYDFDHSGIVNAPYAHPPEELLMKSVQERRYRGYCIRDMTVFEKPIALYNGIKSDIYNLYTTCNLLDEKYVKSVTKYLDGFYATINNSKNWQRDFAYPCDKSGTGNVVIRGLKED
ncbi:MAG TPA: hypothetical protein VFH08_20345 [Chitinophagaceae bacterium]|nr:hypothetical protein [Chitinophagaceae bacterium]